MQTILDDEFNIEDTYETEANTVLDQVGNDVPKLIELITNTEIIAKSSRDYPLHKVEDAKGLLYHYKMKLDELTTTVDSNYPQEETVW